MEVLRSRVTWSDCHCVNTQENQNRTKVEKEQRNTVIQRREDSGLEQDDGKRQREVDETQISFGSTYVRPADGAKGKEASRMP